jgi:hypothetical protein
MIQVKNYGKFQHYKDRNPPWIKLHRSLLDDLNYHKLSGDAAKLLVQLWIIAAETDPVDGKATGIIRLSVEEIAFRVREPESKVNKLLGKLGHWIYCEASSLLATCEHTATPETETEEKTEEKTETEERVDAAITPRRTTKKKPNPLGSQIWNSYSAAYHQFYNAEPVRNARTNSLCKQLGDRLGSEGIQVAAYYLTNNSQYYVSKGHAMQCLVADAEKLRTEWATGNRITQTRAREADRLQAAGDDWKELIDGYKAEEGGSVNG